MARFMTCPILTHQRVQESKLAYALNQKMKLFLYFDIPGKYTWTQKNL